MVETKIAAKHPCFFSDGELWDSMRKKKEVRTVLKRPSFYFLSHSEFKQGWGIDLLHVDVRLCMFSIQNFGNFWKQSSDTDLVVAIVFCELWLYSIRIYLQRVQIFELITVIYTNYIVVDVPYSYLEFHGTNRFMNHSKFALHKTDWNWSASMAVCQKNHQKTHKKPKQQSYRKPNQVF